jgi:hypothetical protein
LKISLDAAFSNGLQFFVTKSQTIISAKMTPTRASIAPEACPFFIKRSNNAITTIAKKTSEILPHVSRPLGVYLKCRFPIRKGNNTIPQTILVSKFKPSKNAFREFEKV